MGDRLLGKLKSWHETDACNPKVKHKTRRVDSAGLDPPVQPVRNNK